jgi:hypothetical protein
MVSSQVVTLQELATSWDSRSSRGGCNPENSLCSLLFKSLNIKSYVHIYIYLNQALASFAGIYNKETFYFGVHMPV